MSETPKVDALVARHMAEVKDLRSTIGNRVLASDLPVRQVGEFLDFARQLERELAQAQERLGVLAGDAIKAHQKAEEWEVHYCAAEEVALHHRDRSKAAEAALTQAQARCAEVENDAARYRWLRETMPMTIGSALKWPYYPAQHDYDVFDAKIDATIDAALATAPSASSQ